MLASLKKTAVGWFVPIVDGPTLYYGGYQDWLTHENVPQFFADRSCGVTACANMLTYMGFLGGYSGFSSPNVTDIPIGIFSGFQKSLYKALHPTIFGLPSQNYLIWGLRHFFKANGIRLGACKRRGAFTYENVKNYIIEGLSNDCPVLMLTWNTPIRQLRWHWVTITGIYRDVDNHIKIITSNWGSKRDYDFDEWFYSWSFCKRVLYFDRA
jgi:hypothetical protein